MKKLVLFFALALGIISAQAQTTTPPATLKIGSADVDYIFSPGNQAVGCRLYRTGFRKYLL